MSARAAYERLLQHPVSRVFAHPMQDSDYVNEDYAKVIPRPMDFDTIEKHLDDPDYTIKKFKADVTAIVRNAIKYFGRDSEFGECAEQLQKLLTKLCCDDLTSWAKRSNHLKNRLGKLLLQKPTLVRGTLVNEIDNSKKIDEQLVSRQEMEAFVKAADALTDKRFQAEMIQIVEKMEPNLRPGKPTNMRIDVVEMKVSTLRALIDYAKAAYAKMGKPYPE